ncbi:MAG: hypothetical protein ACOYMN_23375 [Roseimicrobium sp.]
MTLEAFLGNRYCVTARLPANRATHQRYLVEAADHKGRFSVLSYSDYAKPLSTAALEQQRRVVEVMTRPPLALLCRVTESRLESEYQIVVSEYPGAHSLRELLQQRQALGIEEVEAFLRLLTEACEAAVSLRWPRLQLDTPNLFLDSRLSLPRIPAPDVPLFEDTATDTPGFDPQATMQFNASDLRLAAEPLPKETIEYVQPLAALCCDLLGQPQALRGGNARYQPVPQLSSQQNMLLRRALSSEARSGFPSARAFIDAFYGVSLTQGIASHTEKLRSLSATLERNTPGPPVTASQITVRQPSPTVAPTVERLPTRPVAPLTVRTPEAESQQGLPPTARLRLVPDSEEAPILVLVTSEGLTLGRSAADADFIAQFRPRSNLADGRSRRIGRAQARLTVKNFRVAVEESTAVNPSIAHNVPIPGYVALDLPGAFLLAGEYPVEVRGMPSDYDQPREISGLEHQDAARLQGSIIIRPGGAGVLLCEAAIVFSDVGLHFSQSGRPWFRAETGTMPAARFHRLGSHFWLEPIEPSIVGAAGIDGAATKSHELVLLRDGMKLHAGAYRYTVAAHHAEADASQATSD